MGEEKRGRLFPRNLFDGKSIDAHDLSMA